MSNPKLRQKCEAQRKESEKYYKNLLEIDDACMVILENSESIRDTGFSSYSPNGSMIIEGAKESVKSFYFLHKFLDMWEKNQIKLEIL
jgi:hypothetical protein